MPLARSLRALAVAVGLAAVPALAPGQSPLVTTFAGGAATAPGGALYFDLTVAAPTVTVTRFDLNLAGSGTVEVWIKDGSRSGAITQPSAWTLAATGSVPFAIAGATTAVHVSPFVLTQGTNGIAIRGPGFTQQCTIGNGANQTYSNAHLSLDAGELTDVPFTAPITAPRVPNVGVHYLLGDWVPIPGHLATVNGHSLGFHFVANTDFNLRQLALPPEAKLLGNTASYVVLLNGALAYRSTGNAGAVDVDLHVATGDVVDVIGSWSGAWPSGTVARNSTPGIYSSTTSIGGVSHTLESIGWSWNVADPSWSTNGSTGSLQSPTSTEFGRILMTTEAGTVVATNTQLGRGCIQIDGSCYERFASGALFDLDQSALTLTPNGSGGYTVSRQGALLPVGATSAPVPLALLDEDEIVVPFTSGSFPGWTSMAIASNCVVSRLPGNPVYGYTSPATLLAAQQTAFWAWHDVDPTNPGSGPVLMEQSAAVTVITWDGVWDWGAASAAGANTVQFQLRANGSVTIAWGVVADGAFAHMVGYSPGGASPDPGAADFSALGTATIELAAVEQWPLTLEPSTRPLLGAHWTLAVTHVPPAAVLGIDVLGLQDPGLDELALLGMPGCGLRASLDVLEPWLPGASPHVRSLAIPNVLSLLNANVHGTTAVFTSPPANAFGAITSNGVRGRIGDL